MTLTVEQKSAQSLRFILSSQAQTPKYLGAEIQVQLHHEGPGKFTTTKCKLASFGKSKLKCSFSGYNLIDLLQKPVLIKTSKTQTLSPNLQPKPTPKPVRQLKLNSGWNLSRNRNLASPLLPTRKTQKKNSSFTSSKTPFFVQETMSRLNNLTYGNSCVVATSLSVFILVCLLIWLRNPLLKLIDIYRKDKVTCEIIAIDRKSHFDDSNSSLSGDGEG